MLNEVGILAKFIQLHDEERNVILVNVEEISVIKEIYDKNSNTLIRMRDGYQIKAIERINSVREVLKDIR